MRRQPISQKCSKPHKNSKGTETKLTWTTDVTYHQMRLHTFMTPLRKICKYARRASDKNSYNLTQDQAN